MKRPVFIFVITLVLLVAYFYFHHPLGEKVIVNGHTLNVEVAVTDSEKQKGLGDRDVLAPDAGMLFVYQNKDRYGFWMKGMRFPLDFIWLDGNKVVDVTPNVPAPQTSDDVPVQLSSKVPADKVLEVNSGVIGELGVNIGDTVRFTD